ncbi:uncharacterized protein LOC126778527 [Nymphalis io]|uniref:uncharacterized protein LOC126778527 n=1 Tax=Inachis io TaxID=171585 RepID=UPI002168BE36|nr:uncharacterized protein LOC126778527 [Nymphalis io]
MDLTMKNFLSLTVLSLVCLALGAPASSDDKVHVVDKELFTNDAIIYSGNHKIVNIIVPLNGLNNANDDGDSTEYNPNSNEKELNILLFFVEADIHLRDNRVARGLYVWRDGKATKLLDYGRDAAASRDNSTLAFLASNDGIYVYDYKNNSATKYGVINDNIMGIGKESTGDIIYILTKKHEMFKVSNGGMIKEKINDVVNAKQFVLDLSNNIYFYTLDKQVYVRTNNTVKKIEGLPKNSTSINLIKPPLFIFDDAVPVVVDNDLYFIFANGTTQFSDITFGPEAKPSAYAPDALLVQYYGYNNNIYEFNVITTIYDNVVNSLDNLIENNVNKILSAADKAKRPRQRQSV